MRPLVTQLSSEIGCREKWLLIRAESIRTDVRKDGSTDGRKYESNTCSLLAQHAHASVRSYGHVYDLVWIQGTDFGERSGSNVLYIYRHEDILKVSYNTSASLRCNMYTDFEGNERRNEGTFYDFRCIPLRVIGSTSCIHTNIVIARSEIKCGCVWGKT